MRLIGILHRCQAAFKRHSFVGSVLVYSCLYGGGDVARQTIQRTPKHDHVTTARMAVVGGGCLAPFMYGWYRILDRLLSGRTLQVLVKKVIVDQMVASSTGVFIFYVGQYLKQGSGCAGKATVSDRHQKYTYLFPFHAKRVRVRVAVRFGRFSAALRELLQCVQSRLCRTDQKPCAAICLWNSGLVGIWRGRRSV